MKIRTHRLAWAVFLLLAGAFLLLNNLKVFREFGDGLWGGLFAVVGLGFLIWFLIDRQRTWRAIAGFPLLTIGVLLLLDWRGINLGVWQAALVLFGVALGFWTVLLSGEDTWWALIPAGVLTLMGVLIGFQARLSEAAWLAIFFLGLGVVFGLLYLLRLGQQDTAWAGVPAAAFLLIGVVTLVGASNVTGLIAQWWPILLLVAGVIMLILALQRPKPTAPPAAASESPAGPPAGQLVAPLAGASPAPGSSPTSPPAADEPPVDIYALLAQQPKEDKPKS
ncbi:MAG: hypothetical protein MUC51_10620 [Anaerolineae bacterium]|jgi:hypothetical protein|nr:hypothetical protein [Anaerolineae bacterium]